MRIMMRMRTFEQFVAEPALPEDPRMEFYLGYYRNLTPAGFTVSLEGGAITIRKNTSTEYEI